MHTAEQDKPTAQTSLIQLRFCLNVGKVIRSYYNKDNGTALIEIQIALYNMNRKYHPVK